MFFSNNTTAVFFFERAAFKAVSTSQSSTNPSIPYNKNDQHIFLSASTCSNIPLMAWQDMTHGQIWTNDTSSRGSTLAKLQGLRFELPPRTRKNHLISRSWGRYPQPQLIFSITTFSNMSSVSKL